MPAESVRAIDEKSMTLDIKASLFSRHYRMWTSKAHSRYTNETAAADICTKIDNTKPIHFHAQ